MDKIGPLEYQSDRLCMKPKEMGEILIFLPSVFTQVTGIESWEVRKTSSEVMEPIQIKEEEVPAVLSVYSGKELPREPIVVGTITTFNMHLTQDTENAEVWSKIKLLDELKGSSTICAEERNCGYFGSRPCIYLHYFNVTYFSCTMATNVTLATRMKEA
ncbi:uncharacterized protein [Narcine bancroftii]|uniref:uncharacterized protein isoform X4 n=1 Tax=Narcine bancroftii TaxID=1343680 RepID=UPI003831A234